MTYTWWLCFIESSLSSTAEGSTSWWACEPGVQLGLYKHDAAPIYISHLTDFEVCVLRVYKTWKDAKVSSFHTFLLLLCFCTRLHFFNPPSSPPLMMNSTPPGASNKSPPSTSCPGSPQHAPVTTGAAMLSTAGRLQTPPPSVNP